MIPTVALEYYGAPPLVNAVIFCSDAAAKKSDIFCGCAAARSLIFCSDAVARKAIFFAAAPLLAPRFRSRCALIRQGNVWFFRYEPVLKPAAKRRPKKIWPRSALGHCRLGASVALALSRSRSKNNTFFDLSFQKILENFRETKSFRGRWETPHGQWFWKKKLKIRKN